MKCNTFVGVVLTTLCLAKIHICGVEVWRGDLGGAYLLPTLST
jgi:hypothetical protein